MYSESNSHVNQYLADEIAIYNMMKSLGSIPYKDDEFDLIEGAIKIHLLENARRIVEKHGTQKEKALLLKKD